MEGGSNRLTVDDDIRRTQCIDWQKEEGWLGKRARRVDASSCIDLDASSEIKCLLTNSDIGPYGSDPLIGSRLRSRWSTFCVPYGSQRR